MNEERKTEEKTVPQIPKAVYAFFDIFESLLKAIIIVIVILTFFFKICTVSGPSMNNTLFDGEKLIVSDFAYSPKEGDIVVFHQTGTLNEPIVKRVIATEGKYVKIDFDEKKLYVSDDESFDENDAVDESGYVYISGDEYRQEGIYTVKVPKGHLFVMGDNRNNSTDSRSSAIGLVDERRVLGKVIFRFSPLSKAGIIK